MLLAAFIDTDAYALTIYEQNKTPGRKFLVAGDGGFNLTHGSPIAAMAAQYEPAGFLDEALHSFSNDDLRSWLDGIGIKTFEGSSKRIYPLQGIKPIAVLQAILKHLHERGIHIQTECKWLGWNSDNALLFENKAPVKTDITVFALGGGSWKVTGSNGLWLDVFKEKGISVTPFLAANCAFQVSWPQELLQAHAGKPLKNIAISCGGKTAGGEVVLTGFGLEGNAIYALSSEIQKALETEGNALIAMDFKPMWSLEQVLQKLLAGKNQNIQQILKTDLKLSSAAIQILKSQLSKTAYLDPVQLATAIKQLPLRINASADIDEAISTSGGIALDAIDADFQLKALPSQYCIGEMLNWNAPTGGYLLQACFSMGVALAKHLNRKAGLS